MNFFRIIVPTYNAEMWIAKTIQSVKTQDYTNFTCTIVNDMSTDGTAEIIASDIRNDLRFNMITNHEKGYPLGSLYNGIRHQKDIQDDDIIIVLDGDDWFASEKTLSILSKVYQDTGCLITYGSYQDYPSGEVGRGCRKVPQEIIENNSFRESPWMTSHLRTFKYLLWKNINIDDLKNEQGNLYRMAGDLATMFPMLEMAAERSQFIEDILVIYNRSNPLNADKLDASLQLSNDKKIRMAQKYQRLDT